MINTNKVIFYGEITNVTEIFTPEIKYEIVGYGEIPSEAQPQREIVLLCEFDTTPEDAYETRILTFPVKFKIKKDYLLSRITPNLIGQKATIYGYVRGGTFPQLNNTFNWFDACKINIQK